MKTAEEIFNEHSWSALGAISPSKNFCLLAMDEFADQEVAKEVEAYKERLKEALFNTYERTTKADDAYRYIIRIIDTTK